MSWLFYPDNNYVGYRVLTLRGVDLCGPKITALFFSLKILQSNFPAVERWNKLVYSRRRRWTK